MKNCRRAVPLAILASLLAGFPGLAVAQDTTDRPTAPFVEAVPDFFEWTVTVDESASHARATASPSAGRSGRPANATTVPPLPVIQKVVYTRTKDITRNVILYDNGKSSEIWYYNGMVIIRAPGGGVSIDTAGSSTALLTVPDVSDEGFVGVDWISAVSFRAKTKLGNGREAFIYRGNATGSKSTSLPPLPGNGGNGPGSSGPKGIVGPAEVAIDAESRLPLIVKLAARTLTYSYQTPPSQMLVLPADAQKRVSDIEAGKNFIEKMKALSRHQDPPPE